MPKHALGCTHIFELLLEQGNHVLLDNDALLVEVLDNKVVILAVNVDNDGLDRGVALDEHACRGEWTGEPMKGESADWSRPGEEAYF